MQIRRCADELYILNHYPHLNQVVKKISISAHAHICTLPYLYQSIIFIANNERRFKPERYTGK